MTNKTREHTYMCIDLKSFYASVECVERGLDPMTTNLVVADPEKSDKTICLAVSPSMKKLGVKNRCRVFEIPPNIKYIMAPPRMQKYIDYSAEVYGIYLKYISKEDIHVYSVDEAFMDVTGYLFRYAQNPKYFARTILDDIETSIGLKATCGIGSNLYLAKIAMDIIAKHSDDGIAMLDEQSYREELWLHEPITDFWRIGRGTAKRLAKVGITNMKRLAMAEKALIYDMFGIDGELLIDHAWGRESVTMEDVRNYRPQSKSFSSGQVLMRDYEEDECKTILKEMLGDLCLDMISKGYATGMVTFAIGFAKPRNHEYVKGRVSFFRATDAESIIIPRVVAAYEEACAKEKARLKMIGKYKIGLRFRRVIINFASIAPSDIMRQIDMFEEKEKTFRLLKNTGSMSAIGSMAIAESMSATESMLESGNISNGLSSAAMTLGGGHTKERNLQDTVIEIKEKYGKNSMLKAIDFKEEATARERHNQIGGHKKGT